jgi:hypothetical protein
MIRGPMTALLFLTAAGCMSTQEIKRSGESPEFLISCGFMNWQYCYDRANEICPERYKMLAHLEGMGGKQLRIACPAAARNSK